MSLLVGSRALPRSKAATASSQWATQKRAHPTLQPNPAALRVLCTLEDICPPSCYIEVFRCVSLTFMSGMQITLAPSLIMCSAVADWGRSISKPKNLPMLGDQLTIWKHQIVSRSL